MTTKRSIADAETSVGASVAASRQARPERRELLRSLPSSAPEPAAPTLLVAAPSPDISGEETAAKPVARRGPGKSTPPGYRVFAVPPAGRGLAPAQRRLNVPCTPDLIRLLNQRDRELLESGARWRINRSELLNAAIDTLSQDPAGWVSRYEASRADAPPSTSSLQGRVSEDRYARLHLLRYLPDDRVVDMGPVLAVIIREVLKRD